MQADGSAGDGEDLIDVEVAQDSSTTRGEPFLLCERLRLTTTNSVWIIDPGFGEQSGSYLRMPKAERPRHSIPSVEGRLDDNVRHAYRTLFWVTDEHGVRLRIIPAVGPESGYGVITSDVLDADPGYLVPRT